MGVFFKVTDPNDFAREAKINYAYWEHKAEVDKEKAVIREQNRAGKAVAKEQKQALHEWSKNRLFELHCGNPNCKAVLEYVYDDEKSERMAVREVNWRRTRSSKKYLCADCFDIQVARIKFMYWFETYGKDSGFCLIDLIERK